MAWAATVEFTASGETGVGAPQGHGFLDAEFKAGVGEWGVPADAEEAGGGDV